MKTTLRNLLAAMLFVATSLQTHAQGTLVYDQQSATDPALWPNLNSSDSDGLNIQEDQPLSQSFTPSLSAIGFVSLEFWDIPNNGNNGATVYVNLWTGSPDLKSGFNSTLLGSTAAVYMPSGFNNGYGSQVATTFYFSTAVTLTPGQTYYLQPVVLSGDDPWDVIAIGDTYPNGELFLEGVGPFNADLWFQEGIAVSEPSTLALIGVSCLLAFTLKRRSKLVILPLFFTSVLSIHAADSVVQATADAAGLTPVAATTLPDNGTFWVMTIGSDGNLIESPDPFLPPSVVSLKCLPLFL